MQVSHRLGACLARARDAFWCGGPRCRALVLSRLLQSAVRSLLPACLWRLCRAMWLAGWLVAVRRGTPSATRPVVPQWSCRRVPLTLLPPEGTLWRGRLPAWPLTAAPRKAFAPFEGGRDVFLPGPPGRHWLHVRYGSAWPPALDGTYCTTTLAMHLHLAGTATLTGGLLCSALVVLEVGTRRLDRSASCFVRLRRTRFLMLGGAHVSTQSPGLFVWARADALLVALSTVRTST